MPSKYRDPTKQWHKAGFYLSLDEASKRANELKPKFPAGVRVQSEATKGEAWGKKKTGHRVWVYGI